MLQTVIEKFLRSDKLIVPTEVMRGKAQVSVIISLLNGVYSSFNLTECVSNIGPVDLVESYLSSEEILTSLSDKGFAYEVITVKEIIITQSHFMYDNKYEPVIDRIDLKGTDGRTLCLCRDDALYPYNLTLKSTISV